jgi:LL-diaminopimelate aminotransferase
MSPVRPSARLGHLGSAIFSEIAEWKKEAAANGHDVIDLGIGSPDKPPVQEVRDALADAAQQEGMYAYPTSEGSMEFREAAAEWLRYRFGIDVTPTNEVTVLMGSQDGLGHLALAVTNPGDLAILPDPGYPIYEAGLAIAGVEAYKVPLREENGYLIDFTAIPDDVARRAKLIVVNYPSNPHSSVADRSFYESLISFAKQYEILIVHDAAYSELAFDGYRPMSIMEVPGAKNVAIEFHSMSKSFNMAGCRLAFAIGHAPAVEALRALKANLDYGVYLGVQKAGIRAFAHDMSNLGPKAAAVYEERRDIFIEAMRQAEWVIQKPKATMFVWARIPDGWTSRQISREICRQTGVVVVPGNAFGVEGEGYVRIALVQEVQVLLEAARRIGTFFRQHGLSAGIPSTKTDSRPL